MKVVYHYLSLLPVGWRWHNFPNWEYHSRIFATTYWPQGPAEAFEWLRIFLLDGRQEDEMACEGLDCGTTILLFVILLRFLRTYHGTRGTEHGAVAFFCLQLLPKEEQKNGYFQMDISKQKCLFSKSGLLACAKGCPPPATRGIFYSPPQTRQDRGEREKGVCNGCWILWLWELSFPHFFGWDEKGKRRSKRKKKKADWD